MMKCPLCKGEMQKGKTSMPYETGKDRLIVLKNVPALICEQCGEIFIEYSVLNRVERFLETAEKSGITLGFLEYQEAA